MSYKIKKTPFWALNDFGSQAASPVRMIGVKKLALLALPAFAIGGFAARQIVAQEPLPTGKYITPVGKESDVGSFPCNMALSPDGRFVVVTDTGSREALTVLDANTGEPTFHTVMSDNDGLYYGLAFGKGPEPLLYVSHGDRNVISVHRLTAQGRLVPAGKPISVPVGGPGKPNFIAGLALSEGGETLYAVENECFSKTDFKGAVTMIDTQKGRVERTIETPGFPYSIVRAKGKLYVSCEMDNCVAVLDPLKTKPIAIIPTGQQPVGLMATRAEDRVYVANSASDTVVGIDTRTDKVTSRILLRPVEIRGLSGCTPVSVAQSADGSRLYVPMADWNAVAVVDPVKEVVTGYVPVGWYPTSAVLTPGRLFVANARGVAQRNPNSADVREWGHYILDILEGAVTNVDLRSIEGHEQDLSKRVFDNNRLLEASHDLRKDFKNPGIEYVIYVVKENRTYDQVLGDMPQGDGDAKLCLFGKDVTPNQHALAERFGLFDNFFVCAEVSADGWQWSTAGMANEYTSRNTDTNYGGRGRSYDFEGWVNGSPVDLERRNDVTRAPGGFIWDDCRKSGVSYRNYGFFVAEDDSEDKEADGNPVVKKNQPIQRALQGHTCTDFLQYDLTFADSQAWTKHGLSPTPKQMKVYGSHHDPSRFDTWKREFDRFVKTRKMPRFQMIRFMRDHTAGTAAGFGTPKALVADNDYAVGQLVEAVSHSPFWSRTAIFILEDDAQSGQDHVDAHRSFPLIISPYTARGTVHHGFFNTDSVLHSMELLLGMPPMNQYDAIATPFAFTAQPANAEPYQAILPPKQLIGQMNKQTAYRSRDSQRLIDRFQESDEADLALNDILWHSIKGADVALPRTKGLRTR